MGILSVTSFAGASGYSLYRDSVIAVVFKQELSLSHTHEGDQFIVDVTDCQDLPAGTRLEAIVRRVTPTRDDQAGSIDLDFNRIDFPNGQVQAIEAVPLAINRNTVYRNREGRLVAKADISRQGAYILGGALGGLLVGSLTHNQKVGAIAGAIAGIFAAGADRAINGDIIVHKGQKLGALLRQDVTILGTEPPTDFSTVATNIGPTWHRNERSGTTMNQPFPVLESFSVFAGNRELSFGPEQLPFQENGVTMLPLDSAAAQLGLTTDRTKESVVYVESDDFSLKLEKDSKDYRLNGKKGRLDQPPLIRNGHWYLPAEIFAALTKESILVNGHRVEPKPL